MKYRDIEDAFAIASTPDSLPHVLVHRHTGQMLCDHDGIGEYEIEAARDQGVDVDGPDWVVVPNKQDLELGQRKLAIDFAADHLSDENFCRARGIFFDSGTHRLGNRKELENKNRAWQEYQRERTESALREWCTENDISLED